MHARTVVCFRRTNVASVVKVLHGCKLVQNLVVVSRVNFVRKKKTPFFFKVNRMDIRGGKDDRVRGGSRMEVRRDY